MEARTKRRKQQSGMTIIELAMALVVLLFGLMGTLILFAVGIANNSRNKIDSQAVLVSQLFLEEIARYPEATSTGVTITDCAGNSLAVTTAVGGATLASTGRDIDWTQAKVTNYSVNYQVCGVSGMQTTYEVRWNVSSPTWSGTKLVAVSSRMSTSSLGGLYFTIPITLNTVVGQ